jgi:hypothetical protein
MSKPARRNKYQPRKAIPLEQGKTQHENGKEYARMITAPEVAAYRVVGAAQPKHLADEIDVPGLLATLRDQAKAVSSGDLSRVEALLTNQADSLQALFVAMVERSLRQEFVAYVEPYMRLALKAQSQCRATLQTLAEIRNPPVIYARQANVTSGPQQINNNLDLSRTRENPIPPSQLSGGANALHPDSRASSDAGRDDLQMEAVAEVHGAKDTRG